MPEGTKVFGGEVERSTSDQNAAGLIPAHFLKCGQHPEPLHCFGWVGAGVQCANRTVKHFGPSKTVENA